MPATRSAPHARIRLCRANHLWEHPFVPEGNTCRCLHGWGFIGWARPPWTSTNGSHAAIFEKTSPAVPLSTQHLDSRPRGFYWQHACPASLAFAPLP